MSSFLSTLETAAVKTFDLIFKMIEESTKAVGLALEGHSLIIHPQTVFARGGGRGVYCLDVVLPSVLPSATHQIFE